jgi:hypothetical protein
MSPWLAGLVGLMIVIGGLVLVVSGACLIVWIGTMLPVNNKCFEFAVTCLIGVVLLFVFASGWYATFTWLMEW